MQLKKIVYLIIGVIFLTNFVRADTNVDMSIMTDQDLNFNADLNAGGNIDLTIDGMNFDNTVNDPETTPATGGYTQYEFNSHSQSEFSSSYLSVTGEGNVFVGVNTIFDSGFSQYNHIGVNE